MANQSNVIQSILDTWRNHTIFDNHKEWSHGSIQITYLNARDCSIGVLSGWRASSWFFGPIVYCADCDQFKQCWTRTNNRIWYTSLLFNWYWVLLVCVRKQGDRGFGIFQSPEPHALVKLHRRRTKPNADESMAKSFGTGCNDQLFVGKCGFQSRNAVQSSWIFWERRYNSIKQQHGIVMFYTSIGTNHCGSFHG